MNRRILKYIARKFIVIVLFALGYLSVLSSPILAQQCYPAVVVDVYQCQEIRDKDGKLVDCDTFWNGNQVADACNPDITANPSCQTTLGRCTSADSCSIQGDSCVCSFSHSNCGVQGSGGSSTPPPGVTPPPGCTPSCSSPLCGQWNGCNGYCGTDDGEPYQSVPIIKRPQDVSPPESFEVDTGTGVATVEFRVGNQKGTDRYRFVVEYRPFDNSQPWTEVDRFVINRENSDTANTRYYYTTPTAGKYRLAVRALQDLCANSNWSDWRRFDVTATPTCTMTLSPSGTFDMRAGGSNTMLGLVTPSNGTVQQVAFASSNTSTVTVTPAVDTTTPSYATLVRGISGGTATITGTATVSNSTGTNTCTASTTVRVGQLTGRVCLAPIAMSNPGFTVGPSGNNCAAVPDRCDPVNLNDSEFIQILSGSGVDSGGIFSVNADGTFAIPVMPGTKNIQLNSTDPLNTCECPANNCTFTSVTAPNTQEIRFYYNPIEVRDPWWQVSAGSVYAGQTVGEAVASPIPVDTCGTGGIACVAKLIVQNAFATQYSSGVVVTGGGTIDSKYEDVGVQDNNLDEDNRNLKSLGTIMSRYTENYDYFARLYGLIDAQAGDRDWVSNTMNTLPAVPSGGKTAYYQHSDGNISSPWTINGGREVVVFVNGDLDINAPIDVEPGSFLAIIAQGNIRIGQTVCAADYQSTTGVVEGVFVANGSIQVLGTGNGDCKFVGEGTFVGHSGVTFNRTFQDGGAQAGWNSVQPVVLINYRPDLLMNLPEQMRRAMYQWQEVVQ